MNGVVNQYKNNNVDFDQCCTPTESDFKWDGDEYKKTSIVNTTFYLNFKTVFKHSISKHLYSLNKIKNNVEIVESYNNNNIF